MHTKVSVIIPVHNEEKTIAQVLESIKNVNLKDITKEIIIIDDGSTDQTSEILKKTENRYKIITKRNEGKGSAVKAGILESTGDLVVIQDADLEYDPQEYSLLIEPFIKGDADAVYGSRFMGGRPHRMIYYQNQVANQLLTALSNICTGYNLSDVETGYKMFKGDMIREIAQTLESKKFGFEIEVTAKLAKRKARVFEVGIAYYGRSKAEGKHITAKDGLLAIWEIIKYNLLK